MNAEQIRLTDEELAHYLEYGTDLLSHDEQDAILGELIEARRRLFESVVIPKPHVNHKGPNDNEAAIYRWAARIIDSGYALGSSNVQQSIAKTLRDVAASLEGGV